MDSIVCNFFFFVSIYINNNNSCASSGGVYGCGPKDYWTNIHRTRTHVHRRSSTKQKQEKRWRGILILFLHKTVRLGLEATENPPKVEGRCLSTRWFVVNGARYGLWFLVWIIIWVALILAIFTFLLTSHILVQIITPPRNRGGVIFSLQFVCVSVCVCVRLFSCEQNSSQTIAPIWMRFSLNSCLLHGLRPYWNWWPWVEGQGHCDRKWI